MLCISKFIHNNNLRKYTTLDFNIFSYSFISCVVYLTLLSYIYIYRSYDLNIWHRLWGHIKGHNNPDAMRLSFWSWKWPLETQSVGNTSWFFSTEVTRSDKMILLLTDIKHLHHSKNNASEPWNTQEMDWNGRSLAGYFRMSTPNIAKWCRREQLPWLCSFIGNRDSQISVRSVSHCSKAEAMMRTL